MNIFDGIKAMKSTARWVRSDFIVNGNRRSYGSNYQLNNISDPSVKADLERALRDVENSSRTGLLEYDKLIKELDAQRKQIKELIGKYEPTSKLADIALLVKTDADVIANKIRVVESKRKLESERLKHIREEKKLVQTKDKDTGDTTTNNGNNVIIQNSALGVAQATKDNNSGMNYNSVVSFDPKTLSGISINTPKQMLPPPEQPVTAIPSTTSETPKEVVPVSAEVVGDSTSSKGFNNAPSSSNPDLILSGDKEQDSILQNILSSDTQSSTEQPALSASNYGSDIVVSSDALGVSKTTVADVQKEQNDRIAQRLAHKKEALHIDTMMNYDYGKSLDALVTQSIPHKEKYYINTSNGEYWRAVVEVDNNGNEKGVIPNAPMRSLTHIGSLTCNPKHHTVIAYYYPDPVEYELVPDSSSMPEYYRNEWAQPKNEKYRLTEDQCSELMG